jgi:hypothetical protein
VRHVDVFKVMTSRRDPEPRIVLNGAGGSVEVDAASLLAQYQLPDGDVLLVLDEDSPFEEGLHLVLVRGDRVVDHVVIGAPYASGIYREVAVEDDRLVFVFENDMTWVVRSDHRGSHRIGGLPAGARRRGGWLATRHLSLSRGDAA